MEPLKCESCSRPDGVCSFCKDYDLWSPSGGSPSDGGSTEYYYIPSGAQDLQDLIEHKNMDFSTGNIFKACYRLGEKSGTSKLYDINKILFFAERMKALEERKATK